MFCRLSMKYKKVFQLCWGFRTLSTHKRIMLSMIRLPIHTFTGQAKSSKLLTSIVRILSTETDNCPSWIRERMTVENISWSISTKESCLSGRGRTPDLLITSWRHIQLSHLGWISAAMLWQYIYCYKYLPYIPVEIHGNACNKESNIRLRIIS